MKFFARRSPPMYILLVPGALIGFFLVSTYPVGLSYSLALRAILWLLGGDVIALREHFAWNENSLRILGLCLDSAAVLGCAVFMFVRIVSLEAAWTRGQERWPWLLLSYGLDHPRARKIHAPFWAYLFLLLIVILILWGGWLAMYQE
jgi:hypothetical protein